MIKHILTVFFSIVLLSSGIAHFVMPEFFDKIIPDFFPKREVNYVTGLIEIGIALFLIIPRFRKWGALSFCLLMLCFLPLHVWDLFRESPAVGSTLAAVIRLFLQFGLIWGGWIIYKGTVTAAQKP